MESTEHGRKLLSLLPGWELRDEVPAEPVPGGEREPRDAVKAPAGLVVTLVHAVRGGVTTGVLVRATGGCGKLRLARCRPCS